MAATTIKDGFQGGSDNQAKVNSDGSLLVSGGGFIPPVNADTIVASYPSGTETIYKFYLGGSGGTLLQTITITYTDVTQQFINTVVKS